MQHPKKFWLCLTILLVFHVRNSSSECTITDSNAVVTTSPNNPNAICDTTSECYQTTIAGCATVKCVADSSCYSATVTEFSQMICTSYESCRGATVTNALEMACTAELSCSDSSITGGNMVACTYSSACQNAIFNQIATVKCSHAGACTLADFNNVETVACLDDLSCALATKIHADNVICAQAYACAGTEILATNTVKCSGSSACAGTSSTADRVMCEGQDACAGATITASCLECKDATACGSNLLFVDKEVTGAQPVTVQTGTVYSIGSGCDVIGTIPATLSKKSCFSGANVVSVRGKGVIPLSSLKIGDYVKTNHDTDQFSRVFSFMHLEEATENEYLQVITDSSSVPLEISHDHFVFLKGSHRYPVRATDVKVGDVLAGANNSVIAIIPIKRRGIYAPATESGEIMVSGVHASCYTSWLDDSVAPSAQVLASHIYMAPLRLFCWMEFSICENESYSNDGFSSHLTGMIQAGLQVSDLKYILQIILLFLYSPVMIGFLLLETKAASMILSILSLAAIYTFVHPSKKTLSIYHSQSDY